MITNSYFWLNIFFLAIGTLAIRFSIIAVSHRVRISERVKELFSFIPAAVLPAFVAPAVFFHQGQVTWLAGKERLFVMVLATAVSYFSRSNFITVSFGLIALYCIRLF